MATKTFRRSPGGVNFWMFFRNSPELPPSSATVTMAVISTGFFLRLSRITEIPVPPPITVTLGFLTNDSPFLSVCPCLYGTAIDLSIFLNHALSALQRLLNGVDLQYSPWRWWRTDLPSLFKADGKIGTIKSWR